MVQPKGKREKITFMVSPQMKEMLELRATRNHRSLMQEVSFLVETGLASKSDMVKDMLHLLYKSAGEFGPGDINPEE